MDHIFRDGDIYRWRYNRETLQTPAFVESANCGTLYWCNSRIAIWNEKKERLIDTYWGSTIDNKSFTIQEIEEKIDLTFVANINDLVPCHPSEFDRYANDDCINISHSNSMRGGFYIRKGARESISKKIAVLESQIADHKSKVSYHKDQLKYCTKRLVELSCQAIAEAEGQS